MYGRNNEWKLYLQDLTCGDIEHYVINKFEGHVKFTSLSPDEARYQRLVQEVVDRSQGVFLWVFLVIHSLCDGLTDGDSMITLMARLDHLPADLEDLFRHTLGRVDMFHRKAMAQTFQEALQATEDLPLIAYSFLDETNADFAVRLATQEMNQIELRHAMQAWPED